MALMWIDRLVVFWLALTCAGEMGDCEKLLLDVLKELNIHCYMNLNLFKLFEIYFNRRDLSLGYSTEYGSLPNIVGFI